jgi:hypothetical protein
MKQIIEWYEKFEALEACTQFLRQIPESEAAHFREICT